MGNGASVIFCFKRKTTPAPFGAPHISGVVASITLIASSARRCDARISASVGGGLLGTPAGAGQSYVRE